MRATKLTERIGKKVKTEMSIIHSVGLKEPPLAEELTVDYLAAGGGEVLVGISRRRDKGPKIWSLAAISNADFGKLQGFKKLAEDVVDDDTPVITLRRAIIANAKEASIKGAEDPKTRPRETVVHSVVRSLGN
jgi:hypothetical protein